MIGEFVKFFEIVRAVSNPVPAVLDRLGLLSMPYTLRVRGGETLELRPRLGDLFGFYEILVRGDYLESGQKIVRGSTVIDVGANIGCFTVRAAGMVGPTGRVYALEPDESTYEQLVRNVELNGLRNVTTLRLAVGGTSGTITLHSDTNRLFTSIYSSVNGRNVAGTDQRVSVVTLEALMETHGIPSCDYLKLDCEGAEHEIIRNMTPETARRVAQITMEVHRVPGFDGEGLKLRLAELGYRRCGESTLPYYVQSDRG